MLRGQSVFVLVLSWTLVSCDPGWSFGSELSVTGPVSRECVSDAVVLVSTIAMEKESSESLSVEYRHGARKGFVNIEARRVTIGWGALGQPPGRDEAARLREISDKLGAAVLRACAVQQTAETTFCRVDGGAANLCD